MRKLSILIFLFTLNSCDFFEKDKEYDFKKFYKESAKIERLELNKISFLLASKYDLNVEVVRNLLLAYLEEYDDYSYQLISHDSINNEKVMKKDALNIPEFIKGQEKSSGVSIKIISQLMIDYWNLVPDDELEDINTRLDDLESKIDNVNE